MDTNELLKKVRKIEIKTKTLSKDLFAGSYHSNFKGRGMAFSEVREYQIGDEVRTIDWNVTARYGSPYVKIFEEEREISVMLIADISASGNFAGFAESKKELIAYIAAIVAFSANQNQDKTGLLLFSNKIEKFISPGKGKSQILRIIRELIEHKPVETRTDIAGAVSYTLKMLKKRSIVFIISDFMDDNFERELEICSKKHDTIAIRIYDPNEMKLAPIGIVNFSDAETGKTTFIDSRSSKIRKIYEDKMQERNKKIANFFAKNKIGYINISTQDDYVKELMKYFK